jgi:ribosomal protein S18 acetylase RimI-like enzyme
MPIVKFKISLKSIMEIKIQTAKKEHIKDCLDCAKHSELWEAYYKSNPLVEDNFKKAIIKKQISIALNKNDNCVGFMGIINNGCFGKFSYLSVLAVKKRYRSKGVGKQLINKLEEIGFKKADRVFILVSDFNKKAQSFYKRLGYKKVGKISDLFKNGISEHLVVKYKI